MMAPLKAGYSLSGTGHAALIGWALFGGLLESEPTPLQVQQVTAISAEAYAALSEPAAAADPGRVSSSEIVAPVAPDAPDDAPDVSAANDAPPDFAVPDAARPAEADTPPEVAAPPPDTELSDVAPRMRPPSEEMALLVPAPDQRPDPAPQPRQAPRVTPDPVAPPEPETRIDDQLREEVAPAPEADRARPDQDATSPEESTSEIVTESETDAATPGAAAPAQSLRPRGRPQQAVAQSAPSPAESPDESAADSSEAGPDDTALQAALAEALGSGGAGSGAASQPGTGDAPAGPPLTRGERESLRVAVQNCWIVDVGSTAARVTVTVGVALDREGTVQGPVRRISAEGGDARAQDTAFQAARRAVLRCQRDGYDLPVEKYASWRNVELVFNPDGMRLR